MATTRRGRLLVGLIGLTFLVGLFMAGFAIGRRLSGTGVFAKPESVELPPAPTGSALDDTRAYLAIDGAILADLTDATAKLTADPPRDADCQVVAEQDLPGLGPPGAVYESIAGVPDQPTRELALAHLDATTRFLAGCLNEGSVDGDELRFTRTLLLRRLQEIG